MSDLGRQYAEAMFAPRLLSPEDEAVLAQALAAAQPAGDPVDPPGAVLPSGATYRIVGDEVYGLIVSNGPPTVWTWTWDDIRRMNSWNRGGARPLSTWIRPRRKRRRRR